MGQKQTRQGSEQSLSLNHPRMKQVHFLKNNQLMNSSISVQDQSQFSKWETKLSKLKKFDQYFLLLPKAYEFSKRGVCGSSGILHIDFDHYPYMLHDQILNRAQGGNFFTQTELWYLMYGLVSACNIFREAGMKVGDIQSKNVFLNQQGQMKVGTQCSWPSERTNYQKFILQNQPTYISPEQLQQAKEGRVDIYLPNKNIDKIGIDPYVSQSFSVGMTMLQAASLTLSDSLYNGKEKKFDIKEMNRRLVRVLQNANGGLTPYSKALRTSIMALCEIAPQDRLTASQMYDKLKVNDSELTNLKECHIQAPKLKQLAKYEMVMSKPNYQQNVNYYRNLDNARKVSDSINNYSNPNSLTGTNSTQLSQPQNQLSNKTNKNQTPTYTPTSIHPLNPHHAHHTSIPKKQQGYSNANSYQSSGLTYPVGGSYYQSQSYGGTFHNFGNYQQGNSYQLKNIGGENRYLGTPLNSASLASSLYEIPQNKNNTYVGYNSSSSSQYTDTLFKGKELADKPAGFVLSNDIKNQTKIGQNPSIYTYSQLIKKTQLTHPPPTPQHHPKPPSSSPLQPTPTSLYLQTLYSPQPPVLPSIKTPTFTTAPTTAPTTFTTTYTSINKDISLIGRESQPKGYSFGNISNISSISRQPHYDSANRTNDNIGVFTPTKEIGRGKDGDVGSIDFLRKIDEEIQRSRSKFAENK